MAAGSVLTVAGTAVWRGSSLGRFASMAGTSIATPAAAAWLGAFLDAAYFRRPPDRRELDDLRLAYAILTTRWQLGRHRRLRVDDLLAFRRVFGYARFGGRPGTLTRERLMAGAGRLLGDWFPGAYADPARRGWGIAFPTREDRARYRPEHRLRTAALHEPTPPATAPGHQAWRTYPPVGTPPTAAVLDALQRCENWPDYASEIGRFTPLHSGPLDGQTFEIEVIAHPVARTAVLTRGYVTVTRLLTRDDEPRLDAHVGELNEGLARFGGEQPPAVPRGARAVAALDLTTHEGHFMGRAVNHLLVYEHEDRTWLRTVGTWDPMPWHLATAYRHLGQEAQQAFWGGGAPAESLLHQIASAAR